MMNKYTYKDGKFYKNDIEMTNKQVCNQLNDLEEGRIKKGKEIAEFRNIERLQRNVICGVEAYFKLKEIWY